ncbi:MAG: hypothetical protein HUK28_05230 [Methanobrevibacter sp.]|nr:hypothetical protein [Methanobrevibacter sp.]
MIENAEQLKEKALDNKDDLKKKFVNIPIGDDEYGFRLAGIGGKAVKLEKYVKYDEIMAAIDEGHDEGLEAIIKELIENFEKEEENEE